MHDYIGIPKKWCKVLALKNWNFRRSRSSYITDTSGRKWTCLTWPWSRWTDTSPSGTLSLWLPSASPLTPSRIKGSRCTCLDGEPSVAKSAWPSQAMVQIQAQSAHFRLFMQEPRWSLAGTVWIGLAPKSDLSSIYSLFICQDKDENEDENQSFCSLWNLCMTNEPILQYIIVLRAWFVRHRLYPERTKNFCLRVRFRHRTWTAY